MSNNLSEIGETHGLDKGTGQSRANPVMLAWLAGILDGEGHLSASLSQRKGNPRPNAACRFAVGNTSQIMVDKVAEIVSEVSGREYKTKLDKWAGYKCCKKNYYLISVTRYADIMAVCEAVLPYLVAKQAEAALLIEFCKSRLSHFYSKTFTHRELDIIEALIHRSSRVERQKELRGGVETERETLGQFFVRDGATVHPSMEVENTRTSEE